MHDIVNTIAALSAIKVSGLLLIIIIAVCVAAEIYVKNPNRRDK